LDLKLSILNEGYLKYFFLKIPRQLALDLFENISDWFNILYKLANVLIKQGEHFKKQGFYVIRKEVGRYSLADEG
jgi:hypothetical protein